MRNRKEMRNRKDGLALSGRKLAGSLSEGWLLPADSRHIHFSHPTFVQSPSKHHFLVDIQLLHVVLVPSGNLAKEFTGEKGIFLSVHCREEGFTNPIHPSSGRSPHGSVRHHYKSFININLSLGMYQGIPKESLSVRRFKLAVLKSILPSLQCTGREK